MLVRNDDQERDRLKALVDRKTELSPAERGELRVLELRLNRQSGNFQTERA